MAAATPAFCQESSVDLAGGYSFTFDGSGLVNSYQVQYYGTFPVGWFVSGTIPLGARTSVAADLSQNYSVTGSSGIGDQASMLSFMAGPRIALAQTPQTRILFQVQAGIASVDVSLHARDTVQNSEMDLAIQPGVVIEHELSDRAAFRLALSLRLISISDNLSGLTSSLHYQPRVDCGFVVHLTRSSTHAGAP